jgi:tetratricopeptide (TPR) repeat protein
MNVILSRRLIALSLSALPAGLAAQAVDESALDQFDKPSAAVAAPVREAPGAVELRNAMRRIAQSPNDADALADAGNASLLLGDANAALNFFGRANAIRSNNGRIVAGLAAATVRTENPFEALRLFDDAVRLGVNEQVIAADRALAFDLLGNFARAQQDYRLARSAAPSDDLIIRQAISLSLSGQVDEADAMLVPLLKPDNLAAWRARAFILAARGNIRESVKVTEGFMDADSAKRMERYLRLMPDLTGAQKAAAIHLGHFPASQYVGRDSERVRRVASTIPAAGPVAGESRLIPAGVPLGAKKPEATPAKKESRSERRAREREEVRVAAAAIPDSIKLPKTDTSRLGTEAARAKIEEAQGAKISAVSTNSLPPPETARAPVKVIVPGWSEPMVQPQPTPAASQPPVAQVAVSQPQLQPASPPPATQVALSEAVSVPSVTTSGTGEVGTATIVPISTASPPAQTVAVQGPMPDGAAIAATQVTTATAPQPAAAAPAFDLASIVGSIQVPESEKQTVAAVDLKAIKPTLPKVAAVEATKTPKIDPKAAAKAKLLAANPARIWVQIATGQASALPFDYNKWTKKSPALFKNQVGWTAPWGKSSRLLVGPFADQKAANKWEADFKKAGGDSFGWKSEVGEEVTKLKAK